MYNQGTKQYISKQHIMLINHDQRTGCMEWAVTERAAVVQLRSRLPPGPGRSERPSPPVHPVHGLQLQRQMDVAAAVARVQVHHDVDLLVPAATDALGPSEAKVDDLEPQRAADGHVVGRRRRCSGTAWASHKYLRLVVDLKQSNMSKSTWVKMSPRRIHQGRAPPP